MNPTPSQSFRYSICVSGAHSGETVRSSSELAEALGAAVAKAGHTLNTGATVGLPYHAAYGAKNDCFDFVNFTGLHYVGRDLNLVQSSDAVITVVGGLGTLHEFTSALEAGKPCGVLTGSGGTADMIPALMKTLDPPEGDLVIYDEDPERLVQRVIALIDIKYADIHAQLARDQHWYLHDSSGRQHKG